MHIRHTASHEIGQIYVPLANWLLAAGDAGRRGRFSARRTRLAGAYGIAVSLLMAITTLAGRPRRHPVGLFADHRDRGERLLLRHRLRLLRRELDQVPRGRLVSAAARRRDRLPDADLAERRPAGRKGPRPVAAAGRGPDRNRRQPVPGKAAGHRRVPGVGAQGRAAGADAIHQAQPCAAPARAARHRGHRGKRPASPTRPGWR